MKPVVKWFSRTTPKSGFEFKQPANKLVPCYYYSKNLYSGKYLILPLLCCEIL